MFLSAIFALCITGILSEPQRCCVPWKHSFSLMTVSGGVQNGNARITENILDFNADYTRNMEAFVVHDFNQTTSTYSTGATIINLYNNSTQYIVNSGSCFKRYLNPAALQARCIPANYKYDGTYAFGSAHPVEITSWTGPYLNSTLTITVTNDGDCFPITEKMYGTDETGSSQFVSAYLFVNFQKDVINDPLFTIPADCANAPTIPSGKRDIDTLLRKRLPNLYSGL